MNDFQAHSNMYFYSDIFKLPFQQFAGPLLAKRRSPEVSKQYELIGGSPIR